MRTAPSTAPWATQATSPFSSHLIESRNFSVGLMSSPYRHMMSGQISFYEADGKLLVVKQGRRQACACSAFAGVQKVPGVSRPAGRDHRDLHGSRDRGEKPAIVAGL